ncbi:MAG: hypothetical protein J6W96_03680, partial [Alphaproteobacteria bacterium]|nr:hypothetical protein [Alphaproteobacteria bacterium]
MAEVPCRKEELVKYGKNFDEDRVKVSMRKWLETVKVPADKQAEIMDAMINRYGHQAAYTLMLRAMVEPFYVMQELGESLDGKLTSIGVIRRMATGTGLTSEQVELLSRRTKEPKQNSDDNSKGTNNGSQGQGRQGNSNQSGLSKRGDGGQPQQLTEPTKPVLDEDIAGLPKKRIKEILDESNYDPNNPKYNTWYYFDAEMKRPAALVYVNGEIAYYKKDGKPGVIDRYVHADGSITYYEDGHKAYTQLKDGAVIDEKAQRSQKPSGQGGDEIDNRIDQRKQEKQKK